MRMRHFWTQNGPLAPNKFFSKIINIIFIYLLAPFIAQNFKKILPADPELWCAIFGPKWPIYWNLIGWEPFLAITWEPDFSKACSFLRMLMNDKIFHLTKIPDKINDLIFLKSPKTLFWGHFRPFWSFLAAGDSFQKIWLCHIQLYMSSYQYAKFQKKLMSQFQENFRTDRRTDRRTDTHYFIGPFHPRPEVQKMYPRLKNAAQLALTFRITLTFIEHVNSASIIQIMN